MSSQRGEVTRLLDAMHNGYPGAAEDLLNVVYGELRRLAAGYMRRERPGHILQTTALVHEAYLRLADQDVPWQNRSHFFGVAAQAMRRILVDHARAVAAERRGGGAPVVSLDEAFYLSDEQSREVLALNDALTELKKVDPRLAQVVEWRFFGGWTMKEIGKVMGCTTQTVYRDWRAAQAWLLREMGSQRPLEGLAEADQGSE
jgi:RNA polymerase sigma-70 factor, ECF subfamily